MNVEKYCINLNKQFYYLNDYGEKIKRSFIAKMFSIWYMFFKNLLKYINEIHFNEKIRINSPAFAYIKLSISLAALAVFVLFPAPLIFE